LLSQGVHELLLTQAILGLCYFLTIKPKRSKHYACVLKPHQPSLDLLKRLEYNQLSAFVKRRAAFVVEWADTDAIIEPI
jgi:hypothetical protein